MSYVRFVWLACCYGGFDLIASTHTHTHTPTWHGSHDAQHIKCEAPRVDPNIISKTYLIESCWVAVWREWQFPNTHSHPHTHLQTFVLRMYRSQTELEKSKKCYYEINNPHEHHRFSLTYHFRDSISFAFFFVVFYHSTFLTVQEFSNGI